MTIATPLSTAGRYIVDANGNRVKLAGTNWAGAHQDEMVPGGLDHLNRSAIAAQLVQWGFNSVRFPFALGTVQATAAVNPALVSANPDLTGMTPWQVYQACVAALTAEGIMVIPNCHLMYQGWCCSLADTNGLWWNSNWSYSTFIALWKQVAQTFVSNPLVIGMDIKNEPRQATIMDTVLNPSWGDGNQTTDFRWLYEQAGDAVLAVNPELLVICEGINSSGNLQGVAKYPVVLSEPDKVVYSIHDYPQGWSATETQAAYLAAQATNATYLLSQDIAPLWIGEVGVANDTLDALQSPAQGAGNGLGAGPVSRTYGNWWQNFLALQKHLDPDWCCWHLSGTHRLGTTPSTNQVQYLEGDRTWNGLYAQDWGGPASPAVIAALQAIQAPTMGPGVA
jgi:endoglucanase